MRPLFTSALGAIIIVPPVKVICPIHPHWKWPSLQTGQPQEDRDHVSQFSLTAESPRSQIRNIGGKSHAQQIDVMNHSGAMVQTQHIAASASARNQRLNRVFHSLIAEIAQKRIARP